MLTHKYIILPGFNKGRIKKKMINKNDFIEIEYTGMIKDEGIVFDTTDKKTAEENGIAEQRADYGPIVICVGHGQVIRGLDRQIEGKETGREYRIAVEPEEAFGKKSAQFIQLVPSSKFRQNDIIPQPGMQVNVDGSVGIIKTVSGGRILVDFNHPLSGKVLEYTVKANRKVEDDKEKLRKYLGLMLNTKDISVELAEGKAEVRLETQLPEQIQAEMLKKVKEAIPAIKEITFRKEEKEKKEKEKNGEKAQKPEKKAPVNE
ncbi:hypothetical protein GF323_00555 [Candidatus Woesearchaeota archaeon]|nr:hypothetical protein [Candidatus Woesearchaeota archaeon]